MSNVAAVILAGGSGTRLWPLSRQMFPKQFVSLDGDKSMLAATAARLAPVVAADDVWVMTGADHAKGAGYAELQPFKTLLEPCARNTAGAIGAMAALLADKHGDPVMVVLPADHVIRDEVKFRAALQVAVAAAEGGEDIVTFGIVPTHAETGYGYIKASGSGDVLGVERFVEKPDAAKAEALLAEGGYYWNSGMFVAKASAWLAQMAAHAPAVAAVLEEIRAGWKAGEETQAAMDARFGNLPNISIDYAVMEKSPRIKLVPCKDIGWSDVGSWDAVHELLDKDKHGNVVKADAVVVDSRNNLLLGETGRMIATVGLDDVLVIDTADAVLVAKRGHSQDVKKVVDELKKGAGEAHLLHRTVKRPWGSYTVLEDRASGYKLKRIEVVPGGRLSLQSHKHRSEHWVVVSGVATVTCGDIVRDLQPNQSTYIPQGEKHRLENKGALPVQIIEVQVGDYLGEDDIVRYDDVYGRS